MMCWDTFGRSAVFAAVAAAGWPPWLIVAGPILGAGPVLALYLVIVTAAYLAGMGPPGARRLAVGAGAAVLGCALAAAVHTTSELALGLGALLATARSGVLYRSRPGRAVVAEVALVGGGLLFARTLATPSPFGVMLAVWGFFLVQSTFFLVGGVAARPRAGARRDPFEEAHAQATALLDEV
jgi:hypothetical protein